MNRRSASGDPLRIAEAAYSFESHPQSWLDRLAAVARSVLDEGWGAFAFTYDASDDSWVRLESGSTAGLPDEMRDALFNIPVRDETAFEAVALVRAYRTVSVANRDALFGLSAAVQSHYRRIFSKFGCEDILILNGAQPMARGVCVISPIARPLKLTPSQRVYWRRICVHLAAGFRVGRQLSSLGIASPEASPGAEAVLRPDGTVDHAQGEARSGSARESLRSAVIRLERARGEMRRNDPRAALEHWEGLIDGRWSLLDQFERDGRRYFVAHRNTSVPSPVPPLTLTERQVVAHAALGHSNKFIAYELGISQAVVAHSLRSACAKLGVASRVELVKRYRRLASSRPPDDA